MKKQTAWWLFVCLLILPRILRLMAPDVHIEDPNYIYGAFLILRGMIPFAEFAQVNPPLLETFLAGMYHLFGVSYRVAECLSGMAILSTAVLIFRMSRRFHSDMAGVIASLIYSWHFLVFRYHVFERETWATLAVMAGLDMLTRKHAGKWAPIAAGLLMGLGFACKQTALINVAAIVPVVAVLQGKWRHAALLCTGFAVFTGLITLGYSAVFGRMYMDQTFWFHWIKGYVAPWHIKAMWTGAEFGFMTPLICGGLWLLKRPRTDWNWLWPAMIAADLVFFWFVSGAYWPHYLISTLPPAAILSGMILAGTGRFCLSAINTHRHTPGVSAETRYGGPPGRLIAALLSVAVITGMFQTFMPGYLSGSGSTSRWGFSGTPRTEVAAAAAAIRTHTDPNDLIISDPFIGLAAQRIKVVRFKDNWGLILWMQRMMERGEYREAVRKLSRLPFADIRYKSHQYWMPLVDTAFYQGTVSAVQTNYELPLSDSFLEMNGMRVAYRSDHYTIWVKTDPENTQ